MFLIPPVSLYSLLRVISLHFMLVNICIYGLSFIIGIFILLSSVFLSLSHSTQGWSSAILFPFSFSNGSYHRILVLAYHNSFLTHRTLL